MARASLLICFVALLASGFIIDSTSGTFFLRGRPQFQKLQIAKEVMVLTSTHVLNFLANLEKTCPATTEFKSLFAKFRAYVNIMCPQPNIPTFGVNFGKGMQDSQFKELNGAFGSVLQQLGQAHGSGQVSVALEKNQTATLKALQNCQVTIAKILTENMGATLTAEEHKELEISVTALEQSFSSFVNTAVQEYKAKQGTNSGSGSGSGKLSAQAPQSGTQPPTKSPGKPPKNDSPKDAPKTAKDIQFYTSNRITTFLGSLEKKCPQSKEFKDLFVKIKEYITVSCVFSQTKKAGDASAAKLKELNAAFQGLVQLYSSSGGSAQVKGGYDQVIGMLNSLKTVISNIGETHMKQTVAVELSSEEQTEITNTMSQLEVVFSSFVDTAVQTYNQSSSKGTGQANKGSTGGSGQTSTGSTGGSGQTSSGSTGGSGQTSSGSTGGSGQTSSGSTGGSGQTSSGSSAGSGKTSSGSTGGSGQTSSGSSGGSGQTSSGSTGGSGQTSSGSSGGSGQTSSGSTSGSGQTSSGSSGGSGQTSGGSTGGSGQTSSGSSGGSGQSSSSSKGSAKAPQMSADASAPSGDDASGTPTSSAGTPQTATSPSSSSGFDASGSGKFSSAASPKKSAGTPQTGNGATGNGKYSFGEAPMTSSVNAPQKSFAGAPQNGGNPRAGAPATTVDVPKTAKDLPQFTSQQIQNFVAQLGKNCPATNDKGSFCQKVKEYVKNICLVSTLTKKPGDATTATKFKEVNDAFMSFLGQQSNAGGSGQATATLKNSHKEVLDVFASLQTVISEITEHHGTNARGSVELSADEQIEFMNIMSELESVLSHFMTVAVTVDTSFSFKVRKGGSSSGNVGNGNLGGGSSGNVDSGNSGNVGGSSSGSVGGSSSGNAGGSSGGNVGGSSGGNAGSSSSSGGNVGGGSSSSGNGGGGGSSSGGNVGGGSGGNIGGDSSGNVGGAGGGSSGNGDGSSGDNSFFAGGGFFHGGVSGGRSWTFSRDSSGVVGSGESKTVEVNGGGSGSS